MVTFLAKSKFSVSARKPWTIVRCFGRNRGHSLGCSYSSLEGIMNLKFVPVCSSLDALSDCIIFLPYQKLMFSFWPKTMDYSQAYWPKSRPFFVVFLLLAGRCYDAEICASLLLFRCSFKWYNFFAISKCSVLAENHGLYSGVLAETEAILCGVHT